MTPSVSPEAQRELIEGATYYAQHGGVELGSSFIAEFERSLEVLCTHPWLGSEWRGKKRRFPLRRFPYSIIYQLRPDEIRVIALAHQSRKPGYWQRRN